MEGAVDKSGPRLEEHFFLETMVPLIMDEQSRCWVNPSIWSRAGRDGIVIDRSFCSRRGLWVPICCRSAGLQMLLATAGDTCQGLMGDCAESRE